MRCFFYLLLLCIRQSLSLELYTVRLVHWRLCGRLSSNHILCLPVFSSISSSVWARHMAMQLKTSHISVSSLQVGWGHMAKSRWKVSKRNDVCHFWIMSLKVTYFLSICSPSPFWDLEHEHLRGEPPPNPMDKGNPHRIWKMMTEGTWVLNRYASGPLTNSDFYIGKKSVSLFEWLLSHFSQSAEPLFEGIYTGISR